VEKIAFLDVLDIVLASTKTIPCPVCKTTVYDEEGANDGFSIHVDIPNLADPIPPGVYLFRTWRGASKLMMVRGDGPLPEILVCGDERCVQAVENFVIHEIRNWVERWDSSPHTGSVH